MQYLLGILGLVAFSIGVWSFSGQSAVEQNQHQNQEEQQMQDVITETDELEEYQVADVDFVNAGELISAEVMTDLTQDEIDGLRYMREEEKLARDVYLALYEHWNIPIFNNIAGSESTHMAAVRTVLEKYGLDDPASERRGEFNNEVLQSLYDQLVADGKTSKAAAFTVGAKIEDLDIRDLEQNIDATDKADIRIVYESLQRGSRNHLRAFNRQLFNETGSNYVPEFISNETFEAIIASSVERGSLQGQGGEVRNGGGQRQGNGNGQGRN